MLDALPPALELIGGWRRSACPGRPTAARPHAPGPSVGACGRGLPGPVCARPVAAVRRTPGETTPPPLGARAAVSTRHLLRRSRPRESLAEFNTDPGKSQCAARSRSRQAVGSGNRTCVACHFCPVSPTFSPPIAALDKSRRGTAKSLLTVQRGSCHERLLPVDHRQRSGPRTTRLSEIRRRPGTRSHGTR